MSLRNKDDMRRWMLLAAQALVSGALAVAAIQACLPEQERTSYGPAESLGPRKFPDPQGGTTANDAGGTAPSSLCDGGGPIDGGACDTSWQRDIFGPMLSTTGTMKCASGITCHGAGGNSPTIDNADAAKAWAQLANYTSATLNGKHYLDVCSKGDPNTSAMHCNLRGACGTQMPETPTGAPATADQLATIDKWLACGAPNN